MILLAGTLLLSVTANILLIWYIRRLIEDLFFVSENVEDLFNQIDTFSTHLQEIHELETFYGDSTLQNLIRHSKNLVEELHQYRNVFILGQEEEETLDDDIDDTA